MNASERRAAYLDDLGRLLQPLSAVERIGVIDKVRERIDRAVSRLGHDPTAEEMAGILAGVGAVEDVADDALSAAPSAPAAAVPAAPSAAAPTTAAPIDAPTEPAASWTAGAAEEAPASATTTTRPKYDLSNIPAMEWPDEPPPRPGLTKRWVPLVVLVTILLGAFFLMFLLPAILLIIGVLFLWVSPLWSRAEKVIGTAVPTLGLGACLPLLAAGSGSPGSPALLMLSLVGLVAGVFALGWLTRRGLAAVRRVDAEPATERPKKKR